MALTMVAPPSKKSAIPSAAGLLALLSEDDIVLRGAALKRLLTVVDTLWHEVAEYLPELEGMAEDDELELSIRQTAAAVASRVFFHLGGPNQALRLALEGGSHNFDIINDRSSAYVECLISAAIDAYVKVQKAMEKTDPDELNNELQEDALADIDTEKLQDVVQLMFQRCYDDKKYTHALGVALEARQVPKVKEVLDRCPAPPPNQLCPTLQYALNAAITMVTTKHFRDQVIKVIAAKLQTQSLLTNIHTATTLTLCHQLLNKPTSVADTLTSLIDSTSLDDALLAYQICFDLVDTGDQNFVFQVSNALPTKPTASPDTETSTNTETADNNSTTLSSRSNDVWDCFDKLKKVLVGGFSSELSLSFLHKHSDSDKRIMENLKKSLEERGSARNSVLHHSAIVTHAYLNAGTTNDSFLRDHLDWMRKASNWAKFSATASLGVLHAGHTTEAMTILEPYLPPSSDGDAEPSNNVSPAGGYSEGGSLYALGLIHGSHAGSSYSKRKQTCEFIRKHLRASHANEVISHGAALGVGLTAFGTADLEIVTELKDLIETDSAVAGEAAGIAIGLVLMGTGIGNSSTTEEEFSTENEELAQIVTDLKDYARDTKHEKIIRGIAMGMALINYGQEENADAVIEEMRADRDPILRYGAQYTLALAYCGTGSNKAIRILLHTAVSDVSDDVRMAAVIGLAFVLYKTPERVPQLVKLLLESFNPHVRYSSCMAVGIAMAGSGDAESVALLEPMLDDMTDFVRQGAYTATAMIYMQQSDSCNGKKIKAFREKLTSIISDKHQSTLTKMGAILSTGLIDAGGRNCSLDMGSSNGFTKISTVAGLTLWLQHWHWYPLMHMLSMALTPTLTIGLNKDFKYPKNFQITCNAKPSIFAYPKRLEEKKEKEKKRVETVALSTTAKNNARLARKRAHKDAEGGIADTSTAMDIDKKDESITDSAEREATNEKEGFIASTSKDDDVDMEDKEADGTVADDKKTLKKKKEPETETFTISNPSRITKYQIQFCAFELSQRYRPVRPEGKISGVIILTDTTPDEEEEVNAVKTPSLDAEDEAETPEPFEWAPPGHPDHIEPVIPTKVPTDTSDKTEE